MKGKIFIIEDETSIIQLVQHNLEKEGFVVSSSINGNDGLKELKKFQPNLLLLDWMLPDLSGIDVCKNLRKDNSFKDLPIIMLISIIIGKSLKELSFLKFLQTSIPDKSGNIQSNNNKLG